MISIGNKLLDIPIIQGGMGVGVSLSNLAGNVAACGCMGVISTVNAGYREEDFEKNPFQANIRALKKEIENAFAIAKGKGMVAINAMVATNYYEETVKIAIEAGIDAVISGAGLPLNLPKLTKGTKTAIAPIVSSAKAATLICKSWDKKYKVTPDFVVVEGPMAGGHLGFDKEEVINKTVPEIRSILRDVIKALIPFEEKYGRKIPVFAAGGMFDGKDLTDIIELGGNGVQIATRFIATEECDASYEYKKMIIDSKQEDITIVKSPVGMPGRALRTPLIKRLEEGGKLLPDKCNMCLRVCPHGDKTPYCISRALIEAVKGNKEDGLFFCGENAYRVNKMTTVKELIDEIANEWRNCR